MAKTVLDFEKPIFELEAKIDEMRKFSGSLNIEKEIVRIEEKVKKLKETLFNDLTRWQRVQLARHPDRPYTLDYVYQMTENFVELHGDRSFKDDKAIVGGFAKIDNFNVMIIGHQKGRDTKSNVFRNFGMPNPEGYRKALRLMKLAEKFNKPVITMIDTPGAFPGLEAEERGQAEAIARNLFEMAKLRVPIICIIIGEGASGGALGIGIGDKVLMLEYTWYSVISPESCSSILWRSWDFKEKAAECLHLTADDMLSQKLIDGIIQEPIGGAHNDPEKIFQTVKSEIKKHLGKLTPMDPDKRIEKRINKFCAMGVVKELGITN